MKALLDTCAFLWMITDSADLSPKARDIVADPENDLYLSAASCWEIAIKAGLGRIRFKGNPEQIIPEEMQKLSIRPVSVLHSHALRTANLKPHHRDPFDRILIAQSEIERLPILTPDALFRPYGVRLIW